ncbi:phospholipase D-like domain-containing protein [Microcoleus sp. LAD1_D3]
MNYQFLCDNEENLENKINILLEDSKQFYWSEIYIFSAFIDDDGVEKVKQILLHNSLTENAKVVIAIGGKDFFNEIKNIKKLLNFIESEKSKQLKNKSVQFICPKNNFHIKAYCFLGRNRNKIKADIQIGVSIIGSSNLTKAGLECQGELCISIVNFNLTKTLIARLSKIYIDSNEYDLWEEIINKYKNDQYNSWGKRIKEFEEKINNYNEESPENQNEAESNEGQDQAPPPKGKFIELGVLTDSVLIDKGTNLLNDSEKISCFHSSHITIEQAKKNFPKGSLCLLLTEKKIFEIVKIMDYEDDKQPTQGYFIRFKFNVAAFYYDDIREILDDNKEEYEKIKRAEEEYEGYMARDKYPELEYATLNIFEKKVKEYQDMIKDRNYQKGLKKGKNKMQLEIDRILQIGDPIKMKEELELLRQFI